MIPLFEELSYGALQPAEPSLLTVKTNTGQDIIYDISHAYRDVPIHMVDCHINLDQRLSKSSSGSKRSPFGTVQEFLNRSSKALWGIVTTGVS